MLKLVKRSNKPIESSILLRIEIHVDEMTLICNLCKIVRSNSYENIASTHPCDKQLVLKVFPFDTDIRSKSRLPHDLEQWERKREEQKKWK